MNKIHTLRKKKLQLLKQRLQNLQESFLYYQPHPKQLNFHQSGDMFSERLFLAGNRCGKTYAGAMEMAMHLSGCYPSWWQGAQFKEPIQAWAASNTAESTRDILQKAYLGDVHKDKLGSIPYHLIEKITYKRGVSDGVDTVYVKHISGGLSTLGFKSYDQGREKFQGTSRHFIHLDEEPEMRLYEECLLRTLDVGGLIILTMTPLKGMTDICQHFLNESSSKRQIIQATWNDTTHLSNEEKQRLRQTLRPHELEAREKGVPSLGSGKVYPVTEMNVSVSRFDLPQHYLKTFAIDFGWSNPTAIVWGAKDPETGVVYIYDVYAENEKTPLEHTEVIKEKGLLHGVCDPAGLGASQSDGQSLMAQYQKHGVFLTAANNQVEAGVMQVLEALENGQLKVMHHLEAWWQEFRLYRRTENGKIHKKNDHLMDATRYLIVSGLYTSSHFIKPRKKENDWRTA
jgi:phage terminase large subunit-like protein